MFEMINGVVYCGYVQMAHTCTSDKVQLAYGMSLLKFPV